MQVARIPGLSDLFLILFLALAGAALASTDATWYAYATKEYAPYLSSILGEFAWKVLLATAIGVGISYTPLR